MAKAPTPVSSTSPASSPVSPSPSPSAPPSGAPAPVSTDPSGDADKEKALETTQTSENDAEGVIVTNNYSAPLGLPNGVSIPAGRSVRVRDWEVAQNHDVVKGWLAARALTVGDKAPDRDAPRVDVDAMHGTSRLNDMGGKAPGDANAPEPDADADADDK